MKKLGFTWWPKDWAASQKVQSMDIIERGVYRELIDLVMDAEAPIKNNLKLWARLWRIDETKLSQVLDLLQELEAIEIHGIMIWVPSCEQRLSKTIPQREASRENGKKGGRPPKEDNPDETQQKPRINPTGLQQKRKQQQKQQPKQKESIFEFDEFWNTYDKKEDTAKCRARYEKLNEADRETIKNKLPAYIEATPDKQFRKNPLTWINGKCWLDEVVKKQPQQNNYQPPHAHPMQAAYDAAPRNANGKISFETANGIWFEGRTGKDD